ncbi:MAG TPA: response regulator [Catenuloplanes sp.]|jgi:DNA-binding response OmpR family regulator
MSEDPDSSVRPTVLVVDDEEDLRDIMRRMLERRGFDALVAADPDQAVSTCREHSGIIDILLTDLGLPGVSGGELARTALTLRPDLRVVYVSGLPRDVAVDKGLIDPDARLVKKPFTSEVLVATLRSAMAEAPPKRV